MGILTDLLGPLTGSKNTIISSVLKPAINQQLGGAGICREVTIDTATKSARCLIDMQGESESHPLELQIRRYSLQPTATGSELVIEEWDSPSHPWITHLGGKFLPKITLAIPVPHIVAGTVL